MISTHVLDTSRGEPASGVKLSLEKARGDTWIKIAEAETNSDGRFSFVESTEAGKFRLNFLVGPYFARNSTDSFFQDVPVVFLITDPNRKYHVPLLLNPFGYSTYRGS